MVYSENWKYMFNMQLQLTISKIYIIWEEFVFLMTYFLSKYALPWKQNDKNNVLVLFSRTFTQVTGMEGRWNSSRQKWQRFLFSLNVNIICSSSLKHALRSWRFRIDTLSNFISMWTVSLKEYCYYFSSHFTHLLDTHTLLKLPKHSQF